MGQTLSGNFAFDKVTTGATAGNIRIGATNVSLVLGGGAVSVTQAHGAFLITPNGLAGSLGGTVGLNVPGVTFTGNFGVAINTTTVAVNESIVVAGGRDVEFGSWSLSARERRGDQSDDRGPDAGR